MSDFRSVHGFEDVWRPPARQRIVRPRQLQLPSPSSDSVRARLARVVARAPEVMVKVTGRTRDPGHLRAHLDYISRNGRLELETADGSVVKGRGEVADLADAWSMAAMADSRRRTNSPPSLSVVLSMPAGTDEIALRDAASAFAVDMFAGRHDYVFTLHTDTPRPHVHLSICSRGLRGERLNPKKADLELWRQSFAQALRDRGVEAEATPRRARGVTLKAERGPLRRMRVRFQAGQSPPSNVQRAAYREAARAAFRADTENRPWEQQTVRRQQRIRGLYLAQAELLKQSPDSADQALGRGVEAFVHAMPAPDSQRLALARELRAANAVRQQREPPAPGRDRSR